MGFLSTLLADGDGGGAVPGPSADFWYQPVGVTTPAGMRVDPEGAQKLSAWYRGRDLLATVLAMLPLPVYERLPNDGGANIARTHPLYQVLHDKPNVWQDSFQWRRQKMFHLIDHGNGYDWIVPGARGFVDQLQPITPPTLVTPEQLTTGRILYHVRDPKTNRVTSHTQDEIFHLRGASSDGIVGKGVLEYARFSLGTALATESYAGAIFGKGTLNGGVIENPGLLDDEASKRMAKSFLTAQGDWHLPKVLEQGSKWIQNAMSPEDAQMLLSRKFTVDDIARWLGVPRQMLENSDPSFGNANQFDDNFIAYSMGGWLSLFEFAFADQLFLESQFFAQFTREALARGDLAVRWAAHVAAVNAGIKSVDEVRAVENLNARGGDADELRTPANITGKPGGDPALTPPPPPKQTPPAPDEPDEDDDAPPATDKAQAIVQASAARLLRKEIAAISKAAVKYAADGDAFTAFVTSFYLGHADLVGQTLQMSVLDAEAYCWSQAQQIVNGAGWLAALELWQAPGYAAGLAALALEEAAA